VGLFTGNLSRVVGGGLPRSLGVLLREVFGQAHLTAHHQAQGMKRCCSPLRTKPDLAEQKKSLGCSLLRPEDWLGLARLATGPWRIRLQAWAWLGGWIWYLSVVGSFGVRLKGGGLREVAMPVAASINPTAEPNFSPSVLERPPAFPPCTKSLESRCWRVPHIIVWRAVA
jgi:hypothetical protein